MIIRTLALSALLSGCAQLAPYQREELAHHSLVEPEYAGPAEMHVRAVHEGASSSALSAANGCGCN